MFKVKKLTNVGNIDKQQDPTKPLYGTKILKNKQLSLDNFLKAGNNLEKDFSPINDMRASKYYRMNGAKNLLIKCFYEIKTNKFLRVN